MADHTDDQDWDALYAQLSEGADKLGAPVGEAAGDISMWDVPWSTERTEEN